ncbi:hypothetical protein [Mesorhizobium sp. IMUNJ 23232]|uniref:hypothetical protein n=1 Tax=Mesorhizobium sp. IMUNJ 23232 TaxID=3376064 RepID=UPI0037B47FDA
MTKKLQPSHVRKYKKDWEDKCSSDILSLSRSRFTFYYCIYKNPIRLREAYRSLSEYERKSSVERLKRRLSLEQDRKSEDKWYGMNAVPQVDIHTIEALRSIYDGEERPSYLGKFKPHPEDPDYSTDSSSQEAMSAFHLYDLWCQVLAQVLAEAREPIALEDIFRFEREEEVDHFVGRLVHFRLSIRGKGIRIPSLWKESPVGTLQAVSKGEYRKCRVRMQVRNMYLFSDTAAINLERGRVSGLGILNGAVLNEDDEMEITVIPLVIGAGGWNLHPEHYPTQ